jgi:hypothetical protein
MVIWSPKRCVVVGLILKFNTIGTAGVGVCVVVLVGGKVGVAVLAGVGVAVGAGANVAVAAATGGGVAVLGGSDVLLGAMVGPAPADVLAAVGFAPSVDAAVGPDGSRAGVGAAQAARRHRQIKEAIVFITRISLPASNPAPLPMG